MNEEQSGDAAAEAFEAMRGEVALLRRAVERLAAERQELPEPIDYSETLGHLQKGVNAATNRIDLVAQAVAKMPALKMTPEEMAQRISAASTTARREDQAALAKAGEDKARIMGDLRAVAGSAWSRAEQKSRQLWFGLGGAAIGAFIWAILPGLVAREIAPASWQLPARMAARTLDMPMWQGGLHMMQVASPGDYASIEAGERIVAANRSTLEACRKRANKAREAVRCTIDVEADQK